MDTAVRSGVTSDTEASIVLPHDASSPAMGRAWLLLLFQRLPRLLRKRCQEDAVLCLSELITNAVRHAKTGCRVVVTWTGDSLKITVEDGMTERWLSPPPLDTDPLALWESGRGHMLIGGLADAWGIETYKRAGLKAVWVEFETRGGSLEQKQRVPAPR